MLVLLLDLVITFPTKLNCSFKEKHYFPWPLDAAHTALQPIWHPGFRWALLLKIISLVFLCVFGVESLSYNLSFSLLSLSPSNFFPAAKAVSLLNANSSLFLSPYRNNIQLRLFDGPFRANGEERNQVSEWGTH